MKKSMHKFFSLLLTLVILVSLYLCSACHGSKEVNTFSTPEEFDTTKQYNLVFWAKNDTNKVQTAIYEKAIRDFESLYPNIHITIRLYTDYTKIYNDIITNIPTNTTPNICITYPDHIATYKTGKNTVVELDSLISNSAYGFGGSDLKFDSPDIDEIVPQFIEECKISGHYYALPFMRSTEACYINKTYVEALGYEIPDVLTWDFIWEVADAAMEKDASGNFSVNGQKVMIPVIYKSTDNMMIQYLFQKNAGYTSATGEIQMFNETTDEFLLEIAEHTAKKEFSTFKVSSYPANFLNAGQCIFAIDSTAGSTWMGSDAPLIDISEDSLVPFETVVKIVPQANPENSKMISQGPSVCIFNKEDPQEVLASWLFTQYLLSNDVQIAYAQTEGYVPVTLKAQQTSEYQTYLSQRGTDNSTHYAVKIDATKLLLENADKTFTTEVFNGSASVRNAAGQMIENVVKSVNRKEKVDAAYISSMYQSVISLYHLDQLNIDASVAQDLGPLPSASRILIITLMIVWCLIGAYLIVSKLKKKK